MSINVGRQVNLIAFHRDGSIGPEMPGRRFPPPWSVETIGPCFVVKDAQKWNL
jgi:hypothetical protein